MSMFAMYLLSEKTFILLGFFIFMIYKKSFIIFNISLLGDLNNSLTLNEIYDLI